MSMHHHASSSDDDAGGHAGHHSENGEKPPGFWISKTGLAAIGFMLIAAFLLLSEHRAHAFGYLPFLLLLACPLLHMFMHSGHGGHGAHGGSSGNARAPSVPPPRGDAP